MVDFTDLKLYKTTNNLGGSITTTEVFSNAQNNVFHNVNNNDRVTGKDYYACIYVKNTHASESMQSLKMWLSSKSLPLDTELKWGFDPSATAQTIANENTAPTGITWHGVETESSATNHGTLSPGSSFPIWLWLHVNANALTRLADNGIFTTNLTIPQGGSGSGGTGGGDTGGGTGGNPPPTATDYKIAIAGDWGCETETDAAMKLCESYDYVIGVGDNAYESAGCWTTKVTNHNLKSKMTTAFGNHEYEENGGITPYMTYFGYSKTYFVKKFENVMVIVIDTNINCDPGSTQHNFVTQQLQDSQSDSSITWRIAVMHHPWFGQGADHPANEFQQVQAFHSLFTSNNVQFVCTGHNHNWQRSKKVTYNASSPRDNPTVVDSTSPFDASVPGIIHVVSGTGGHDSGSGLYGLPDPGSWQGYGNRTHNGIWEVVASNNGQTLTCSFVDNDGSKFDTIVINSGSTVTTSPDQFGITKLFPTKTGGREWFNKWNNSHARTINSSGTGTRNTDPDDIYVDFHCNSTSDQGNVATIDGHGICRLEGGAPRMYINDKDRVLKWNNCEVTVYYRYLQDDTDDDTGIHVHCRITARSEHQDEYLCCGSGHTMGIFESKKDGTLQLRKELIHPAYADNEISGTTGGEVNTWIGMKLVLRDESGKPRVRAYRDTTDGLNGGTWTLLLDKTDDNDWAFTDGTEITSYDACSGGTGTCAKITPRTSKIVGAANSCYLRCDSSIVEFKKFSIREIDSV